MHLQQKRSGWGGVEWGEGLKNPLKILFLFHGLFVSYQLKPIDFFNAKIKIFNEGGEKNSFKPIEFNVKR